MNTNKKVERKRSNQRKRANNRTRECDPKSREAKDLIKQEESRDYNNNPSFYFTDKTLIEQVCSFSFNQFIGANASEKPFNGSWNMVTVPSVLTMRFNPSCGWADNTQPSKSGINIAALKLYSRLSSMNAKTTNYAPQDVAALMLALGSIIELSEYIRRAFGVAFTYNKRNWAYPKKLIEAMGVDAADLFTHLAPYRIKFNTVINMINQIAFPFDVSWFAKCQAMYSHIYLDSESPMSQSYLFVPATVWGINETISTDGTVLETIDITVDHTTGTPLGTRAMSVYIAQLEAMIQAILTSATFNYIYADVLRLVDPSKLLTIPFVDEGYIVMPEYDPMMLVTINNAVATDIPLATSTTTAQTAYNNVQLRAGWNAIQYMPVMNKKIIPATSAILNFPHSMGNPDADQKIEATRMVAGVYNDGANDIAVLPDHYLVSTTLSGVNWTSTLVIAHTTALSSAAANIAAYQKFDWAPRLRVCNTTTTPWTTVEVLGDLDFFTDFDLDKLSDVNNLAYTTLFNVNSLVSY